MDRGIVLIVLAVALSMLVIGAMMFLIVGLAADAPLRPPMSAPSTRP